MTAPSAPILNMKQYGGKVRLAWRPVDSAIDYNVYMGSATAPVGLEDSVNFSEAAANGWFIWWTTTPQAGGVFARITALNVGAEESAYSNEKYVYISEVGPPLELDPAIDILRRGLL